MIIVAAPSVDRIRTYVLSHMLMVIQRTPVHNEPFSHFYLENVFPEDLYGEMLEQMPEPAIFRAINLRKNVREDGVSTRDLLELNETNLPRLDESKRAIWRGVASALLAPELKDLVFRKLAHDLKRRFEVDDTKQIVAYPKPALIRDLGGYEIAPHPDTRSKIVTMQLYLPCDMTQLDLGTALYQRRLMSLANLRSWKNRFRKVKQFDFKPNSGYAFAVSRKSWHGRELVPMAAGVRNSLMNIYYADPNKSY